MSKKVLIITYYWPPVGGSGVQRWLKMSRYLTEGGWEPVIYTPENPSFGSIDKSLEKDVAPGIEVIRLPIWEPYQLFSKIKGKDKTTISAADINLKKKDSLLDKIFLWIRGNIFIPDPRVFWVRSSVKFLPGIIQSNNIDAVITTGPPHSLHLIGMKLKKKTGIKWLADFRDPWTQWDLYDEFQMTGWAKKIHRKLERSVLQNADKVTTINTYFKKEFEKLGDREVEVVSNGYDEADFKNFTRRRPAEFTIRHIGIVDEMRDPSAFLQALEHFIASHPLEPVTVEFIGNVTEVYKKQIKDNPVLDKVVKFSGYKPHSEIIRVYEETSMLLLILTTSTHAAGNTTGKLYEYLASGSRILALGPVDGEVARILAHTGAGSITEHQDVNRIAELLEDYYHDYKSNVPVQNKNVTEYSRRAQALKVASILDNL